MTHFYKKNNHLIFIFFVVLLGLWQVSFLVNSLKWDLIDVVFPFRYYFSEAIQSGYFPFWNPYLQTGTPFFADLQAPTFYPELLFVSLFTGYGIYTMHILFVLYVFIAAVGMFHLSYHFNRNKLASFMAAISYALSGYIIGHGQHFFLLVGAAWIPFVLTNYLQLLKNGSFIQLLKTAVFVFLMVSGAYQALSFVLFYLLLLIFVGTIINELVAKNKERIIQLLKLHFFLALIVIGLLLPLIFSTIEIITSVDRLNSGISLEQTLRSNQSWKGVISFFLPFSTLKYDEFFGGVDASMRNHYFGLLPLLFLVLAALQKRTKTEYLLLIFGLVIFASSFQFLPVRKFLFEIVPLMNLFKYAAYVSIFGLLALILLAANYFAYLERNLEKEKTKLMLAGSLFLLVFISLIIYSLQKTSFTEFGALFNGNSFSVVLKNMQFYQHVLSQSIFQLLIILSFFLIIAFRKKLKNPFVVIILLVVFDLVMATQLNMSFTITDNENKPFRMKHNLALTPPNFPLPLNDKIIYNDQLHAIAPPFWRNTYNFTKQVSFGAFSSFELNSFSKLDDEFPNLRDNVLNNHLLYFSDSIQPLSRFDDAKVNPVHDADLLYLSEEEYNALSTKKVKKDSTDLINITAFSPNKITVETSTKNDQFLTMLQTNFNGWKASVDGNNTPIYTSNFNYRTIFLPSGEHTVTFEYKNNKILVLYIISNILFFFIILFILGHFLKKRGFSKGTISVVLAIILIIPTYFLFKRLTYNDNNLTVHQLSANRWANEKPLFSFSNDFENETVAADTITSQTGKKSLHVKPENEYVTFTKIVNSEFKLTSATLVVTAWIYPENYVEALIVSDVAGENTTDEWNATRTEKQIEKLGEWNKITYQRNLFDLNEHNEINVYLWNKEKMDFRIDNITVEVYPLIKN